MKNFFARFRALVLLSAVLLPGAFVGVQAATAGAAPAAALTAGFLTSSALVSGLGASQACGALNANTALKLDKVLRDGMRALKKRLSPVLALSTVMRDQVLTETNTVQVPFYPLETLTSRDFDGSYSFAGGDANVNAKSVTVNKRKYQPLEFTSKELARNSVVDLNRVLMLKIEKLAEDVLNDIFSVVTAANFPSATVIGATTAFDRFDIADLRPVLTQANWPAFGRALVLESAYEGALVKDQLNVQTVGTTQALREGSVGRLVGFDIFDHPNMPTNGENLIGAAILPYAICAAFAPIDPAPEVMDRLSEYKRYVDPETQLTLEYRAFGDATSDSVKRTVEVNYGYALGDPAQLRRLTSA